MKESPTVAVTIGRKHYKRMMSQEAWTILQGYAKVTHHPGEEPANKQDLIDLLADADACLTSWGVATLDSEVVAAAPSLKAIAHMGGSVKSIVSSAVWARGIQVTTAAPSLGTDVAETTLGLMIIGMKRIWPLAKHVREGGWRESRYWPSRELHNKTVGIVGVGNIGKRIIRLLQAFDVKVLLYDSYMSQEEATQLSATKVELDQLIQEADIISLHLPSLPSTKHILDRRRLQLAKDDAVIINTARGSLIDESALIDELEKGRFFIFLDVTDPEPPAADSPLRRLENVVVTPHLAGCIEDCTRMGEMAVEELRRFFSGEPPIYPVTVDMLDRIA